MNVAFFSNQFAESEGHGLFRYARELYGGICRSATDINLIPCAAWSNLGKASLKHLQQRTGLELLPSGRRLTPLFWTFLKNPSIEFFLEKPVDLVHAVSLGYPVATRKPYVVTVHDIGPLSHPEFFSNTAPWIMKQSLKQALKKADAIVCVSHSTANELSDYVGNNLSDRIYVAYEGVSPLFFQQNRDNNMEIWDKLSFREIPFIMAAGKISPRKNVAGIIQAMNNLKDKIPHHLVLVGAPGWEMNEVMKKVNDSRVADRIHFTGYVSDEQLRTLYSLAALYIHPSFYEGFGLTVLEAMASGCPVITSNVYSLKEVAGDAALLVDPGNMDEITGTIQKVCTDTSISENLIRKGRKRAGMFSWDRCAEQVAEVYRKVV